MKENKKKVLGDVVLVRNMFKKDKMDAKWNGPYVVKHARESGSYIVSDVENLKDMVVKRRNLKRITKNNLANEILCEHSQGIEREVQQDQVQKENKLEKQIENYEENANTSGEHVNYNTRKGY